LSSLCRRTTAGCAEGADTKGQKANSSLSGIRFPVPPRSQVALGNAIVSDAVLREACHLAHRVCQPSRGSPTAGKAAFPSTTHHGGQALGTRNISGPPRTKPLCPLRTPCEIPAARNGDRGSRHWPALSVVVFLASPRNQFVEPASLYVCFKLLIPKRVKIIAKFFCQLPGLLRRQAPNRFSNFTDCSHVATLLQE
jgi:hypothetical protein